MKTINYIGVLLISLTLKSTIASLDLFNPTNWTNRDLPMAWIDGRYRAVPYDIDTFFDRVVILYHFDRVLDANGKHVKDSCSHKATGVFITSELILTSYNALRNVSGTRDTLNRMRYYFIKARYVYFNSSVTYLMSGGINYALKDYGQAIVCGRQVIPSDPAIWPTHMQHGPSRPAHDLMVLRAKDPVKFIDPIPRPVEDNFDFSTWEKRSDHYYKNKLSPIRTILAKPGDKMYAGEMRFASMGHLSDEHIELNRYLERGQFGDEVDCEKWMPREWGHFICIQNTENYPGLTAGAMLYSGEQLFGVGAFMLKKGKDSILVFTDVRPYWHLLYRTCTKDDQNLVKKTKRSG